MPRIPKRPGKPVPKGRQPNPQRLKLRLAKGLRAVQETVRHLEDKDAVLSLRDRELLRNIEDRLSGSLVSSGVTNADLMNIMEICKTLRIKERF